MNASELWLFRGGVPDLWNNVTESLMTYWCVDWRFASRWLSCTNRDTDKTHAFTNTTNPHNINNCSTLHNFRVPLEKKICSLSTNFWRYARQTTADSDDHFIQYTYFTCFNSQYTMCILTEWTKKESYQVFVTTGWSGRFNRYEWVRRVWPMRSLLRTTASWRLRLLRLL